MILLGICSPQMACELLSSDAETTEAATNNTAVSTSDAGPDARVVKGKWEDASAFVDAQTPEDVSIGIDVMATEDVGGGTDVTVAEDAGTGCGPLEDASPGIDVATAEDAGVGADVVIPEDASIGVDVAISADTGVGGEDAQSENGFPGSLLGTTQQVTLSCDRKEGPGRLFQSYFDFTCPIEFNPSVSTQGLVTVEGHTTDSSVESVIKKLCGRSFTSVDPTLAVSQVVQSSPRPPNPPNGLEINWEAKHSWPGFCTIGCWSTLYATTHETHRVYVTGRQDHHYIHIEIDQREYRSPADPRVVPNQETFGSTRPLHCEGMLEF